MDTIYVDVCDAGKQFFWCVTGDWDSYPLAHGYCETLEEAEEKMWSIGTILAKGRKIEDSRTWQDRFPFYKHGRLARNAKRAVWKHDNIKPSGEYLYCTESMESDYDGRSSLRHEQFEIVKKTAKNVFVKHDDYCDLVVLDRQRLELCGNDYSRRTRKTYCTLPYEIRCADEIAEKKRRTEELAAELQAKRNAVTDDDLAKVRQIFDEKMTGDLAVEMAYMMKKCGVL